MTPGDVALAALTFERDGDLEEAARILSTGISVFPLHHDLSFRLALVRYKQRHYRQCFELLDSIYSKCKGADDYWQLVFLLCISNAYFDKARDAIARIQSSQVQFWCQLSLAIRERDFIKCEALSQELGAADGMSHYTLEPLEFLHLIDSVRLLDKYVYSPLRERFPSDVVVAKTVPMSIIEGVGGRQARRPAAPKRILYLSGDFREHAMGFLVAPILSSHSAEFVKVGLSTVALRHDSVLGRVFRDLFDEFHDVSFLGDKGLAHFIRELRPDLIVDLSGHTEGGRLAALSLLTDIPRATYLGFPGFVGSQFVDYVIGDEILFGGGGEKIKGAEVPIELGCCYQPYDSDYGLHFQELVTDGQARKVAGGVIVGCLNRSNKISLRDIRNWIYILKQVPTACFVLLDDHASFQHQFSRAVANLGGDIGRFIFEKRRSRTDYLLLLSSLDLMLDSSPYGAHTTAGECLMAGTPILSKYGSCFHSRVTASILYHAGLSDLSVADDDEYVSLAVRLLQDVTALAAYKARIAKSKATEPYFDIRHFISCYESRLLQLAS